MGYILLGMELHKTKWKKSVAVGRSQVLPIEGVLRVIGETRTGRILTAILAPKGEGVYYPVTTRPASRKERKIYRENIKKVN